MKVVGASKDHVRNALRSGDVQFAVYGLGKMGLPLAAVLADSGARVTGVDIDEEVVLRVNRGECPVTGEPGLAALVRQMVDAGRLRATSDGVHAAAASDVMVILVPALLTQDKRPDLSAVMSTCRSISRGLERGDLVILETTVPPRTTECVVLPALQESGLALGEFGLAFCPERTASGRALKDIRGAYPKVVGGVDAASCEAASAIYEIINSTGVTPVSDSITAEAVKLFECIHRDVSIGFANEVALLCEELGIDVAEVMARAEEPVSDATGRPAVTFLRPGAGVGGHCIPVYPYFVMHTLNTETAVIHAARRCNEGMPGRVVDMTRTTLARLGRQIGESHVLVMGAAFRPGVRETRNSPGLEVARQLLRVGATVFACDAVFSPDEIRAMGFEPCDSLDGMDCVVVVHESDIVTRVTRAGVARMRTPVLVDCCQCLDTGTAASLGFVYRRLGCGR